MGNKGWTVYCHFSFKRPKGKEYGYFATAFYKDFEGKDQIGHIVRKVKLWEDQQFVAAVQSYEYALSIIYENQVSMIKCGIRQVMLVTDNSTLAKWILNPKKNKYYAKYVERAYKSYCVGAVKEITIGVGLCEPRNSEKSYKYCKESEVTNKYIENTEVKENSEHKIVLDDSYKSITDLIEENVNVPRIDNMEEL